MANHTAGPWAVNPINAQVDAFVGGSPLPVCKLLWPTTERTEEETEANAHLIAAAPDLYDALKKLVVVSRQQDTVGAFPADKGIAYGAAEAALAKANPDRSQKAA